MRHRQKVCWQPCVGAPHTPSSCAKMASPLFCHGLLNDFCFKPLFCIHLLQTGILGFQLAHSGHQRCIHTCIFGAPFVEGGRADAMLSTHFWYRCSSFCLLQDSNDLAICKSWLFQAKSPAYRWRENSTWRCTYLKDGLPDYEKIQLNTALI